MGPKGERSAMLKGPRLFRAIKTGNEVKQIGTEGSNLRATGCTLKGVAGQGTGEFICANHCYPFF